MLVMSNHAPRIVANMMMPPFKSGAVPIGM